MTATGVLFCGLVALLADRAVWLETAAQSFVPYVAVPFAVGLLRTRSRAAGAALAGALSSVSLVVSFYGTTALHSPYPISMYGPWFFSLLGMVSGAVLALSARWVQPRTTASTAVLGTACCSCLVLAEGWVVRTGRYSTAEMIALALVLAFWCAVVLAAIRAAAGQDGERAASR